MYKIKYDANGNIDIFKARYVAKCFKQIEWIEYSDTFAPTSKPETFEILLALSAIENFLLKQMDVKAAFLHPKIDEQVYLEKPKFFEKLDSNDNNLVSELKKNQYMDCNKQPKIGIRSFQLFYFSKVLGEVKLITVFFWKTKKMKNYLF